MSVLRRLIPKGVFVSAGGRVPRTATSGRGATEVSLRCVEEHFDHLVAVVKDYAIFLLDPEGHVLSWNAGAEQMKGYRSHEILGRHFSCFYPEEALQRGWPAQELKLATTTGRFEDEGWRLRKDGSRFWANVVITALQEEDGRLRGFLKITRDLTENRAAEEALRLAYDDLEARIQQRTEELTTANATLHAEIAARERLEEELRKRVNELAESDRYKNEFLAMLSHELRNPLAPIRNALQVLNTSEASASELQEARMIMGRQLEHMVRLVEDLLDLSRIVRGRIQLLRERVELAAVVAAAVEAARPEIEDRAHDLSVSLPPQRIVLHADQVRLAQALSNLLINAAKYTPKAGRICLTAECEDEEVVVRVRDTGMGISSELLPRIFDLFVQADKSLARSQGGLGIGLTLVKRVVSLHGGRVVAMSAGPGRGSEFIVYLPTSRGKRAGQSSVQPKASPQTAGSPRRVLVVDDNVDSAMSTAMLLRLWGHEARAVHDGPAALRSVREFGPDIVLLDIGLPGLSGYEVARQLRSQPESGFVVLAAMTGYGQDEDRFRSREFGFDRHLTKPIDPAALLSLVSAPLEPSGRPA